MAEIKVQRKKRRYLWLLFVVLVPVLLWFLARYIDQRQSRPLPRRTSTSASAPMIAFAWRSPHVA